MTAAAVTTTLVAAAVVLFRFAVSYSSPELFVDYRPPAVSDWRQYDDGARVGPNNARLVIVVFSDYLCPYCRQASSTLRAFRQRYPASVAIVWRHYPFLSSQSTTAAIAAECARRVDRFGAMHEILFSVRDSLGVISWAELARRADVADSASFIDCMRSEDAARSVRRDRDAGRKLGLLGTPSLLVDSLFFEGPPDIAILEAYAERVLPDYDE